MVKEYQLQGLGCAACAAKIEHSVRELEGVTYASLNFMTSTLRIEASGDLRQSIEDAVHRHEADVSVLEKTGDVEKDENPVSFKIARLAAGAAALAVGFALNHPYSLAFSLFGYLVLGGELLYRAVRNILRGKIFDENFLMAVATIGAFAIGEYTEAVGVMLFYQVGLFFQELAVQKSKKSIARLLDIRPDFARLQTDGAVTEVAPETVQIGDLILVKPGERIPLDGVVVRGQAMLETSALTGESVPRRASVSDTVLSGCVNLDGALTIEVTQTFGESTVAKIIRLVESAAEKKAPTENFITTFARTYTPVVVCLAALIAVAPPLLFGGPWADWLSRALIFLVISCPCALVISIPLGYFGGIGGASRRGILIKGSNYLEALNHLDIVVFDKTGTLTKGVFEVTALQPAGGFIADELLEAAATAEALSNHPIALSILRAYGKEVDTGAFTDYAETAGQGVRVNVGGRTILAGNRAMMEAMDVSVEAPHGIGTTVYVASDGAYMGSITISDELKPDSRSAIAALKAKGIGKTVMLTGDNPQIAEMVAGELKLDEVYGGLLPQQKVEMVETLSQQKRPQGKLAFVGDGINDAPVLAMADVGVAMGGLGSDAAIEAADIVILTDQPSKLAEAVDIARFTKRVVWQNIVFALGVKAAFLMLGAAGLASMWEAVFADVGVSVLAILNATRVLKSGRSHISSR